MYSTQGSNGGVHAFRYIRHVLYIILTAATPAAPRSRATRQVAHPGNPRSPAAAARAARSPSTATAVVTGRAALGHAVAPHLGGGGGRKHGREEEGERGQEVQHVVEARDVVERPWAPLLHHSPVPHVRHRGWSDQVCRRGLA